jgi:hypothetical protein
MDCLSGMTAWKEPFQRTQAKLNRRECISIKFRIVNSFKLPLGWRLIKYVLKSYKKASVTVNLSEYSLDN